MLYLFMFCVDAQMAAYEKIAGGSTLKWVLRYSQNLSSHCCIKMKVMKTKDKNNMFEFSG